MKDQQALQDQRLMSASTPHPANVPGDFYVEDGCCTMCEVPLTSAPDLFGVWDEPQSHIHCFVKRQPETSAELEQMLEAVQWAEFQCIHYRGTDRLIQLKLVETNVGETCDHLPADLQKRVVDLQQLANREAWKKHGLLAGLWAELGFSRSPRKPWWKFWQ